jgi:hypothetical protein
MTAKNSSKCKRMKKAVAYMQDYMTTYSDQYGYEDYTVETYIHDVLYGLGISLGGKPGATGYDEFKKVLRKFLDK